MALTKTPTYTISLVSVLSFFGIVFGLMPVNITIFGYLPFILFIAFFIGGISAWLCGSKEPHNKLMLYSMMVIGSIKILLFAVGSDPYAWFGRYVPQ